MPKKISQKKIDEAKKIIAMMDKDNVTLSLFFLRRDEFVEKIGQILTFLKNLKKNYKTEVGNFFERMKRSNSDDLLRFRSENTKIINKALKEQENGLNFLRDKAMSVRDFTDGKDGIDGIDGIDGSSDTPGQIANKLEELKGESRLKIEAVLSLEDRLKKLEERPIGRSGGGARKVVYLKVENLSSQVNGTLKTFTMPKDCVEVVAVYGTQFPVNFNKDVDWTFEGRTLTLTSEVSAPKTGQTLYALVNCLFYG